MGVRLVALVPVLGLLLAGCTSSAEEPPLVQPPAFSATPTPSAVALEVPPSARATNAVGAAAFARFYLQVLSDADTSGDAAQLRALSHPECSACSDFIAAIQREVKAGKRFEGGQYQVRSSEATETAPGDAIVDVVFDRAASRTLNANGTLLQEGPAETRQLLQMRAVRQNDGWVARGVRFPQVPQ